MSIKQVQVHPLFASDPTAQARTVANVEAEFQKRVREYGTDAAKDWVKSTHGVTPTLEEVAEAENEAAGAKYAALKQTRPFAAIEFARDNPAVYRSKAGQGNEVAQLEAAKHLPRSDGRDRGLTTFEALAAARARARGDK